MNHLIRMVLAGSLLVAMGVAGAQQRKGPPTPTATMALPAWEQLSDAQRELLVAPLRERWNASPSDRARMYDHAERWRSMTPEQRNRARRGMRHWEHMDPQRQKEMRALFGKMRSMTPEQRNALRDRWHAMSAEERRAWVEANPPKDPR
jgi:hypothetical protein